MVDLAERLKQIRAVMEKKGLVAAVILNPDNQFYLTGFKALIYSRPIILVVDLEKELYIVPGLEEIHAKAEARVGEILVYYEHPELADRGTSHVQHLRTILNRLGEHGSIGIEYGSCPTAITQQIQSAGYQVIDLDLAILKARSIKSDDEVRMIREAGRVVSLGVMRSIDALYPGMTEIDVDKVGNAAILEEVSSRYPDAVVDLLGMTPSGKRRTVMPHVFSNTRRIEMGDVLIHTRQVGLHGYRAECERTCFAGQPSQPQQEAFEVMLAAQDAAIAAVAPGVPMKEVDLAARRVMQENGFGDYAIHRTGHSIGISAHEPPFLRFDEEAPLEVGMVFTIEPGLYVPGLGGFRHSDTILVTSDGGSLLTNCPRDLKSMTRD